MNPSKLWLILRREYIYNFTRKSYLISAFVIPLIIGAAVFIVIRLIDQTENNLDDFNRVGYVDLSGIVEPHDEFSRYAPFPDETSARAAFNAGDIGAYFILPADYLNTGQISYFSDARLVEGLRDDFEDFLLASLSTLAPESHSPERLRDPVDLNIHMLGEAEPLSEETAILRFALPAVFGFIFLMNVITASQFLMSGLAEEKENNIMEILLTSVTPLEMITGKVLGLGALAFTQLIFWTAAGLVMGMASGQLGILRDAHFEISFVVLAALYFILSFLVFAGIMVGVGAIGSAEQESRQIAGVFTLLALLPPSWGFALFITNPQSPFVILMSLFPLTSPLSMMILLGLGEAQTWQIALSLLILAATVVLILWLAARIFRVGMLMSGQRLSLKQLRHVLRG